MAFRPRTPTFRPQLSVRRVYETLQPRSEIKEIPDAYLLHVYVPGFARDSVKITYVGSSRMVRITGERPITSTRWIKFDQSYPVPENCEAEALQAKFDIGTLILTMPKKVISQDTLKQPEEETTQEKGVAEAKPDEKAQETIPSQPTTTKVDEPIEEKKSASLPSPVKDLADLKSQKATHEDISSRVPPEPIKDHSPQKGQEEAVERPSPTVTGKPQMAKEELEPKQPPTMETKMQTDEKPQKGQEEVEPKSTPTMETKIQTDEKPQKGQEEFESKSTPTVATKIKTDEQPPKDQEEGQPKPTKDKLKEDTGVKTTLATVKEKLEEKKTEGTSAEDAEKERISKKEVKEEDHGKPSEIRKHVKDKKKGKEKENKTKELSAKEAEPSAPKIHKKKEKKTSSKTGPNKERKSEENIMDTAGDSIRELVASASQVVSRIAEGKWNEEEKHLVANIGAALLVITALGAYVSYRFVS